MLWLVWHMWILLLLAFAGGLIAGWILRSRSDDAPERAALAAPAARPAADPEPSPEAPPAPHVPAPEPTADTPAAAAADADKSGSKVAAAFTAPDVSEPEAKTEAKPAAKSAAKSLGGGQTSTGAKNATSAESAQPAKSGQAGASGKTAKTGTSASGKAADKAGGDDLTAIKGLGPKAAEKLNEAGVKTLSQIASWSAADIEKYDELLKSRGRIARDDWVGQAKALKKT